MHHNSLHRTE